MFPRYAAFLFLVCTISIDNARPNVLISKNGEILDDSDPYYPHKLHNEVRQQMVFLEKIEICEGQAIEISCDEPFNIRLYNANIIEDEDDTCSQPSRSRSSRSSTTTIPCSNARVAQDINRMCDGKTSCSFKLGDCWDKQQKYVLEAQYSCQPYPVTTVPPKQSDSETEHRLSTFEPVSTVPPKQSDSEMEHRVSTSSASPSIFHGFATMYMRMPMSSSTLPIQGHCTVKDKRITLKFPFTGIEFELPSVPKENRNNFDFTIRSARGDMTMTIGYVPELKAFTGTGRLHEEDENPVLTFCFYTAESPLTRLPKI